MNLMLSTSRARYPGAFRVRSAAHRHATAPPLGGRSQQRKGLARGARGGTLQGHPSAKGRKAVAASGPKPTTAPPLPRKLEKQGLVERLPDPDDRRSLLVRLTDDGYRLISQAITEHVDTEAQLLAALSEDEQQQLNSLLKKWLADFE